ncbi:MAG: hypothetical protein R3181_14435 [Rubricoccaceae bacterium]|nr:hypothetical protein [Rubricoccaceae bacterium]
MFRLLLLLGPLALAACAATPPLPEGRWTGALTPERHPELKTPVAYDVRYEGDRLVVAIVGPGGQEVPTRDVRLTPAALVFAFDEPEEGVPLHCVLDRDGDGGFAGRCTAPDGQWARFTMRPPE